MFKNMFKNIAITKLGALVIVGAVAVVGLAGYAFTASAESSKMTNEKFDTLVTKDAAGRYTLRGGASYGTITITTERSIVVEMHEIANNYIIADEIRGKREMTQEGLNTLILELLTVDKPEEYPHKEHLLDILSIWKQGEFFMLANDHNYVWGLLDGTVGKATGVKERKDLPAWAIDN